MRLSLPRQYIRRADRPVVAVRLAFDPDGFVFRYRKWQGEQNAKAGDWLVETDGDIYTVDAMTFLSTYRPVDDGRPGCYVKTTPVWAQRAERDGEVKTAEGSTKYRAGDYLVSNSEDDADRYAISAESFEKLYMPVD
jgi:hypothetical protein